MRITFGPLLVKEGKCYLKGTYWSVLRMSKCRRESAQLVGQRAVWILFEFGTHSI